MAHLSARSVVRFDEDVVTQSSGTGRCEGTNRSPSREVPYLSVEPETQAVHLCSTGYRA